MNVPKLRFKEFNDEYKTYKFYDVAKLYRGSSPRPIVNFITKSEDSVNWIKIGDVSPNETYINSTSEKITEEGAKKSRRVYKGEIILSNSMSFGRPYILNLDGCIHDGWFVVRDYEKLLNKKYLYHFMSSPLIQKQYKTLSAGGVVSNISSELVYSVKLNIPSKEEQLKVAKFLSLLDKKIELQNKKIEDLKLFKLYTKNQIFKDYDERFKLKDILVKWNKKNKNNSVKYVESISNKYGFISQSDQFEDRNVASKDLNNYYIIEKGVFGYNPSRLNVGSLALKTNDKVSVVSPLYECFTTSQNNQYLLEWFDSKYFRKETISKFEGGVRNTLNFSNLCEIEIGLPTIEKQNMYSRIFKIFNNKIEFEVKKLYKLQELKKGLLQSMFV